MQNMRNELRGCLAYTCSIRRAPTIILVSCLMVLLSYSLALAYTDSETQLDQSLKIVQSEDRSTIAWWIPASLWEELIYSEQSVRDKIGSADPLALRDYDVFLVIDIVKSESGYEFSTESKLAGTVELSDSAGHVWTPLSDNELGSDARSMLEAIKPYIAEMIGSVTDSDVHLLAFSSGNPEGEQYLDQSSSGTATLTVDGVEVLWDLPLFSSSKATKDSAGVDLAGMSPRNRAEALNEEGFQLALQGDYEGALDKMNQAIAADPTFWEAAFGAGFMSELLVQYEQAVDYYTLTVTIDDTCIDAYFRRANIYMQLGEPGKAVDDYTRVLDLDPQIVSAYFNRGNAYLDLGDLDAAIEDYSASSELDPSLSEPYFNKAVACESAGRYAEAKLAYEAFISVAPAEYAFYVDHAKERIEALAEH